MFMHIAFIAAIFLIACVILGGLALLCWHSHPRHARPPLKKKPLLSNWK
jgi:hypothetical protein